MDGRRGVSLAIGAGASRGLRNIEKSEACRVIGEFALSAKRVDDFPDIRVQWVKLERFEVHDGSRVRNRRSRDKLHYCTVLCSQGNKDYGSGATKI